MTGTRLQYLGQFPLMNQLGEYVQSKRLEHTPRFAWTTFAAADRTQYRALVLWIPVEAQPPMFQFCPVLPTRPERTGIAKWAWTWDGNLREPTLEESIQCVLKPPAPQWHGHVRQGRWIPC